MKTGCFSNHLQGCGEYFIRFKRSLRDQSSKGTGAKVSPLFLILSVVLVCPVAFADNTTGVSELPEGMQIKAQAYQSCINTVMSTFAVAALKRQHIADTCSTVKSEFINTFPVHIQPLIASNTDRRLDAVLNALEQIETAVMESAADVNEISQDLQALDNSESSQ